MTLRTSPWSGQAAVESASIAIASGLPLRGSVRRIRQPPKEEPPKAYCVPLFTFMCMWTRLCNYEKVALL